jgi:hypothetical protein
MRERMTARKGASKIKQPAGNGKEAAATGGSAPAAMAVGLAANSSCVPGSSEAASSTTVSTGQPTRSYEQELGGAANDERVGMKRSRAAMEASDATGASGDAHRGDAAHAAARSLIAEGADRPAKMAATARSGPGAAGAAHSAGTGGVASTASGGLGHTSAGAGVGRGPHGVQGIGAAAAGGAGASSHRGGPSIGAGAPAASLSAAAEVDRAVAGHKAKSAVYASLFSSSAPGGGKTQGATNLFIRTSTNVFTQSRDF